MSSGASIFEKSADFGVQSEVDYFRNLVYDFSQQDSFWEP